MIYPRCMKNKPPAYSATGYILPCCWCDNENIEDFDFMMKEHLHISNIDTIDDVFLSDEWTEFRERLETNPPRVCKKYCSSEWETKRIENE